MKYIIITVFGLFAVWLLQASGLAEALVLFMFVGIVPGTAFSLPPLFMLGLMAVLLCLVIWVFAGQEIIKHLRTLRQVMQALQLVRSFRAKYRS